MKEEVCIEINNASYSWGFKVNAEDLNNQNIAGKIKVTELDQLVLQDVNLQLKSNDFLVVIGKVGVGKTSLLYSIMEETKLIRGNHTFKGSVAYVE